MKENEANLVILKKLVKKEDNRRCADCDGSNGVTWASVSCGVFLCMRCAGIHRGLGVHISQVRSITLDTWLPNQVLFLENTGNKIANDYWEATLPQGTRPNTNVAHMTDFIKQKYVAKSWADGTWPPQDKRNFKQDCLVQDIAKQSGISVAESKSSVPDHWVKF
eukprot:TRINITY_DN4047_c3_g1_i5.p1 TRINITY_DN4047_c3_g1~~TRINITY_DN4047_c3_g1_i5.p1  ORF type:complete len:186 (-),score=8.75 TRINITY_DN4047_c3_g1_i5:201-692(-)